jgi:sugar phosphate isomerase/epimerase
VYERPFDRRAPAAAASLQDVTISGGISQPSGSAKRAAGRRRRPIGIGHLTMLDVSPPDLVAAAATADLDFVGLRVAAGGPGEELWPLSPGAPMLHETLRRLDDTGLFVNEVDVLPIRPGTRVADVEPTLELAALLGARYLIAFVEDPDLTRVGDLLAALGGPAAAHGVRVLVEPMSYKELRSFAQARELLAVAPATGIVVDPLQLVRCGDTLDGVRALDPASVPFLQLCDGPLTVPTTLPDAGPLPRGQSSGSSITQYEARAWRQPSGEGDLPLAELTALLPDVPLSVEAPNLGLSRLLDPVALARRHRAGVERVLRRAQQAAVRATG